MATKKKVELNQPELLFRALAEISQEKDISKEDLILALEASILQAAQRKYTNLDSIEVELDGKLGTLQIRHSKVVVKEVEDPENEIDLDDAKLINESAEMGDQISFVLDPHSYSNVIAQATRHIMLGKVRDIEKEVLMRKFADKIGSLVHGKVAKIERNRVYVVLTENAESVLDRRDMLWNDKFQSGDPVRALLLEIRAEGRNHVLVLTRTHPDFLLRLLESEIPEIFDRSIEVKKIARDPGGKAKVLVKSIDEDIDPVGACIGPKGQRINNIVNELNGERIDVIAWHDNVAELIGASLNVEGIKAITVNSDEKMAYVEIAEDAMPAALGRRGQNVRLTEILTDFKIQFMPFSAESHRKELLSNLFKDEPTQAAPTQSEQAETEQAETVVADNEASPALETEGLAAVVSESVPAAEPEAENPEPDTANNQEKEGVKAKQA